MTTDPCLSKPDDRQKFAFVINALTAGGAERFTTNLANYWASQGHEVCIATIADSGQVSYALHENVQHVVLDTYHPSQSAISAIRMNVRRVRRLRRFLREFQPNAAIALMAASSCLLALAGAPRGTVCVGSERTYPPRMPLGRLWNSLRRHTYARLDFVVAQTDKSADWLRCNTQARHVEVIPNPVAYPLEIAQPEIAPDLNVGADRRLLLAVGRLGEEKGFDRLISAFSKISGRFPDWDLAILGEGSLRGELEHQIAEEGQLGRVLLPGRAGNVADWLLRADLFAMTSHFEGFPNVLIEAMSYGLPAVSFDCDTGPRDVISSGLNGILVPQDDVEALANSLADLMGNPERRDVMAANAIKVRETFSMATIAKRWRDLFDSAALK